MAKKKTKSFHLLLYSVDLTHQMLQYDINGIKTMTAMSELV